MSARRHPVRSVGIGLVILWSVMPIYWAIRTSLQTESAARSRPVEYIPLRPNLDNFRALLFGDGTVAVGIRRSMVNIIIECTSATVITVTLAALAAYAFARFTFRGRNVLFYGILATMAFPPYTTLIPLYRIMSGFGLINTYTGIVLVYVSGFLPLAVWVLHNYFSSIPVSIEEAGLIDGASRMQVFRHLVLPLAVPGVISVALITFLFGWAQFLFPLVLSTDLSTQPLTVIIAALQGKHTVPSTLMSAAGLLAIAVPAAIALTFNRYIVNGLLAGSNK